jgi:hypothetical protein
MWRIVLYSITIEIVRNVWIKITVHTPLVAPVTLVTSSVISHEWLRPFGLLPRKDFKIIWLSNRLTRQWMWLGVIVWGILEASTVHWIIYLCFYDKDSTLFTTSYSLFIRGESVIRLHLDTLSWFQAKSTWVSSYSLKLCA